MKSKIISFTACFIFLFSVNITSAQAKDTMAHSNNPQLNVGEIVNVMNQITRVLKNIPVEAVADKAVAVTKDAISSIDWNNIKQETVQELKDAQSELKKIDWNDVGNQLTVAINEAQKTINSIDWGKIGDQIQKANEKIDKVIHTK